MSHVASVILITSGVEHNYREGGWLVDKFNAYLEERHGRRFVRVDEHSGGDKGFQARVYLVAINYLDIEAFLEVYKSITWGLPDMVQLMIRDEHDDFFTSYRARGSRVHRQITLL
jgi:hypothetical protein